MSFPSPPGASTRMMIGGIILGSAWQMKIRLLLVPTARAAWKLSFSLMAMTALRSTLELVTPEDKPRTRMICTKPGPVSDMIVSNNNSPGIAIHASMKRCATRSNLPPRNPAVPPINAATTTCGVVAVSPTKSEMRAPWIRRLRR